MLPSGCFTPETNTATWFPLAVLSGTLTVPFFILSTTPSVVITIPSSFALCVNVQSFKSNVILLGISIFPSISIDSFNLIVVFSSFANAFLNSFAVDTIAVFSLTHSLFVHKYVPFSRFPYFPFSPITNLDVEPLPIIVPVTSPLTVSSAPSTNDIVFPEAIANVVPSFTVALLFLSILFVT